MRVCVCVRVCMCVWGGGTRDTAYMMVEEDASEQTGRGGERDSQKSLVLTHHTPNCRHPPSNTVHAHTPAHTALQLQQRRQRRQRQPQHRFQHRLQHRQHQLARRTNYNKDPSIPCPSPPLPPFNTHDTHTARTHTHTHNTPVPPYVRAPWTRRNSPRPGGAPAAPRSGPTCCPR